MQADQADAQDVDGIETAMGESAGSLSLAGFGGTDGDEYEEDGYR